MKRLASFITAGAMTVLLSACGQEAPKKPEVQGPAPTEQQAQQPTAPQSTAPEGAASGAETQE